MQVDKPAAPLACLLAQKEKLTGGKKKTVKFVKKKEDKDLGNGSDCSK